MKQLIIIAIPFLVLIPDGVASSSGFWINEFHYDNAGTDVGEFVEVAAPADFTELASVRLTLYNGGDGSPYGGTHLLDSFTRGETVGSVAFYSKAINGMQNGAPDGLALDLNGSVLHFISYEGMFTASAGPAAGLDSVDTGIFEADTGGPGGSIGLTGAGGAGGDFLWASIEAASPGGLNLGQTVIPEPRPGLILAAGLGTWILTRRRRPSHAPSRARAS